MTAPKETLIRNYIATLLRNEADVGNRVFTNRKSVLFKEELPAVSVEYGVDNYEIAAGDKYKAELYEHKLNLSIVIAIEDVPADGVDQLQNQEGQDQLDLITKKVKDALGHDWRLSRLLADFDPNDNYEGLANGLHLLGGATYEIDTGSEQKVIAREIGMVVFWTDDAFPEIRFSPFQEYRFTVGETVSGGSIPEIVSTNHVALDFDDSTPNGSLIGIIPAGKYASFAVIQVSSAFDADVLATVGDAGDTDRLMENTDSDMDEVYQYMTIPNHLYAAATEINLYLSGTLSIGSGRVIVYYG